MSKHEQISLSEVHETVDPSKSRKGFKRVLAFLGPAYLVSVGYMDPGNWATDLQGGARFGYKLIWVLLMSNLMALLLQSLSARLGIVRRRDLAQANRDTYPPFVNFCLYLLAEVAIAACDLAEVLGMAIGIYLLTGLPLIWGVSITVLDTFLILFLQRYGMRFMEAFIFSLVLIIGASFLIQIFLAKPDFGEVATGLIPTSLNSAELYIAIGIIGATVMPHNLYLHSALVQTRKIGRDDASIKKAIRYNVIDSAIALNAAFFVNAGILVLAATVFYKTGNTEVARIEDAHSLLAPMLGTQLAPILFAVALIAAGQSSTVTGTLAGQIVMEGYLHLRINPMLRRLLTRIIAIAPAFFAILWYGDQMVDELLIFSQVILSLQLGFAIIPLIHFVSDKKTMGKFAINIYIKVAAWLIAGILIYLNVSLVQEETAGLFSKEGRWVEKLAVIISALAFFALFLVMTFYPLINKMRSDKTSVHGLVEPWKNISIPQFSAIAVALDFSAQDEKLMAHALKQASANSKIILLHVTESASAKYSGSAADDDETRKDIDRLHYYAEKISALGYKVELAQGYKSRVSEIVRLTHLHQADLLICGAHRHRGIFDFIYGSTINALRHQLSIPVLVIS